MNANVPANLADTIRALQGAVSNVVRHIEASTEPGGPPILSIDKVGRWNYGQDGLLVDNSSLAALDPTSLRHGWVAWKDSKPHSYMVSGFQPKPDKATLPSHGVDAKGQPIEYQETIEMHGVFVQGRDKGVSFRYNPSSTGGVRALRNLLVDLLRQAEADPAHLTPVVHLEVSSYNNKKYGGVTYVPILNIVGWAPTAKDVSAPAQTVEPEQPRQQAQTTRQQPQETPAYDPGAATAEPDREAPKPSRARTRPAAAAEAPPIDRAGAETVPAYTGTMAQRVADDTAHQANVAPPFDGGQPAQPRRRRAVG